MTEVMEDISRSEPVRRFASLVRKARERREFSQAVVAQLLKVEPDVIKRLESGRSTPNLDLVADLTVLFELPLMNAIYGQRVAQQKRGWADD
jgi:ribosome-binding protein aMBF1 (putative translation factor)|tara:strand:+ start:8837 stop:9112 length:276 start_codon:yes stop_codon:yes gene_type:complete